MNYCIELGTVAIFGQTFTWITPAVGSMTNVLRDFVVFRCAFSEKYKNMYICIYAFYISNFHQFWGKFTHSSHSLHFLDVTFLPKIMIDRHEKAVPVLKYEENI